MQRAWQVDAGQWTCADSVVCSNFKFFKAISFDTQNDRNASSGQGSRIKHPSRSPRPFLLLLPALSSPAAASTKAPGTQASPCAPRTRIFMYALPIIIAPLTVLCPASRRCSRDWSPTARATLTFSISASASRSRSLSEATSALACSSPTLCRAARRRCLLHGAVTCRLRSGVFGRVLPRVCHPHCFL